MRESLEPGAASPKPIAIESVRSRETNSDACPLFKVLEGVHLGDSVWPKPDSDHAIYRTYSLTAGIKRYNIEPILDFRIRSHIANAILAITSKRQGC